MTLNIEVIESSWVKVLVTSALLCFFVTDANVVISSDEKPCVCGRNITLTCKLKVYTNTVSWMNDNDVIPIAKCTENVCKTNPVYDNKFRFTSDLRQRIFKLTIINVTMNDNGRELVCSDGSNTESWRVTVKECEPMIIAEKENSITVLSGCSSQEVTFKWLKVDSSGDEREFKPTKRHKNTKGCTYNAGCGNKPQTQYLETIYVKPSVYGKFLLKSIGDYGNETLQSTKSSKRYTIDEMNDDRNVNTLLGAFGFVVLITLVVILLIYYNKERMHCFSDNKLQVSQKKKAKEGKHSAIEYGYCGIDRKPEEGYNLPERAT